MNMDQKTIATYDAKAQDYASKFDSGAKAAMFLIWGVDLADQRVICTARGTWLTR